MFRTNEVSSSAIAQVGYDDDTKALYIEFLSGAQWIYPGVPYSVYTTLLSADSIGCTFSQLVRNSYPGEPCRFPEPGPKGPLPHEYNWEAASPTVTWG